MMMATIVFRGDYGQYGFDPLKKAVISSQPVFEEIVFRTIAITIHFLLPSSVPVFIALDLLGIIASVQRRTTI
jgi:hypothetical protein